MTCSLFSLDSESCAVFPPLALPRLQVGAPTAAQCRVCRHAGRSRPVDLCSGRTHLRRCEPNQRLCFRQQESAERP